MTDVTIISGFLGAGKTTLIKKLLSEVFQGQKVVLLENEYGEVGIDGGFMKDSGIQITELNSGCICCTLAGDFQDAINEIVDKFSPDRLIIEPSGVGKLSDIRRAVETIAKEGRIRLGGSATVVDANKCKMYLKNFGEFFIDQVKCAETVIFSRSQLVSEDKLKTAFDMIRELNADARIITTPWSEISGRIIFDAIEHPTSLIDVNSVVPPHEHHHDDDDEDEEEEHEHHHHHHDGEECDDPDCECHHHHHHGHHHADDVFTSWGMETPAKYTKDEIEGFLGKLTDAVTYGMVLRAKGMVPAEDGSWIYFDYVPGESNVREGAPQPTGKFCVIGSKLNEEELEELFKK
jgi:G3E family GTPase